VNILRISVLLFSTLMTHPVLAEVSTDVENGISIENSLEKNLNEGASLEQLMPEAMKKLEKQRLALIAAAIKKKPEELEKIMRFAFQAGIPVLELVDLAVRLAPNQAATIVKLALDHSTGNGAPIVETALAAGASRDVLAPFLNQTILSQIQKENQENGESSEAAPITQNTLPEPLIFIIPSNGGSDIVASPN